MSDFLSYTLSTLSFAHSAILLMPLWSTYIWRESFIINSLSEFALQPPNAIATEISAVEVY